MIPRVLIIAGSDSGGGAGIQADIKTVTMLGGHATTAITAITAQNTLGVQAVHAVPTDIVLAQMRSVIDDIGVDAVKIGMIGSAATAHAVADMLEELTNHDSHHPGEGRGPVATSDDGDGDAIPHGPSHLDPGLRGGGSRNIPIVFDPVMVATSGSVLADADTIAAFTRLMAMATVVTPNTFELSRLSQCEVTDEISQRLATGELMQRTGCHAILAKGGHLAWSGQTCGTTAAGEPYRYDNDTQVFDVLFEADSAETIWNAPRIDTKHTHGTGCTLASAIATGLGGGMTLADATGQAIRFVRASLEHAPGFGAGHGPMGQQLATGFRCPA